MEKWDQTQQGSCPADGERSVTLPKCSLFQGTWKKIGINIQGRVWVETWAWPWGHLGVLHGLRKVILGKPCPAGEVRVKEGEQRQHLPWTQASLENMEVFWGRQDSFYCYSKKSNQFVGKIFIGILVTSAAQSRRGALQLVSHILPWACCVCKCICSCPAILFPCMECLSAFLLGKKRLSCCLIP